MWPAVDTVAVVYVMHGAFKTWHLLAEARRDLTLVLRGRPREPGLDERIVDAAIDAHCLDIGGPKTVRGLLSDYRLYTARWALPGLQPARRPAPFVPGPDPQPPADPGAPAAPRPPDRDPGERGIPRVPLRYDRAVLAGAVVREKLRTAAGRGRAYDVAAHQQAAMPEQLLAHREDTGPDRPVPGEEPRSAIDLTAVRALKKSRTDVEARGLTDEQLRRLKDASARAGEQCRKRAAEQADRQDAGGAGRVRESDQQPYHPKQPDPHHRPK